MVAKEGHNYQVALTSEGLHDLDINKNTDENASRKPIIDNRTSNSEEACHLGLADEDTKIIDRHVPAVTLGVVESTSNSDRDNILDKVVGEIGAT